MKKHLFGTALLMCLVVIGGMASAQTIDEIQVYDALGAPASPYVGQAVTVTGAVYVQKGTYNSGTWYIQGATGGINFFDSAAGPFNLGDVIELSGTVGAFGGEINISSATAVFLNAGPEVVPTDMDVATALDTESVGTLAKVIGTVATTAINGGSDSFEITDGVDTMIVYIDSDTAIDLSAVAIGDTYSCAGPIVIYNGTVEMKPRFQADLVENPGGDTLPVIADINSPDWVITAADPLTITASITDDGAITSASLFYADANDTIPLGGFSSVAMTNTGGDTYSGTIPGGHAGDRLNFYIEATDDGAQTVTNPGAAPTAFHSAGVGFSTLYEINTVSPDSAAQPSPLNGHYTNIHAVVTAGTGLETGAPSRFVLQEMAKNPETNSYAYGGILVYEGTGSYEYFRGDEVEINGTVGEFFGLTEFLPLNADAVNLIGFGAALPEAEVVSTRELADNSVVDGNGYLGERWESVWVKTFPATVVDTLGFGNYIVSSTGARVDSLDVAPITTLAYVGTIGDVLTIESYMTYAGGDFRIVPSADDQIVLTGLSAVDNNLPSIENAGGFRSIAPNPFNPMTEISFVVNRSDLVQLNVYNIRGEKVRTLVQDKLGANEYKFVFDGKNDAGQTLASGAYFARLRIGKEVVQVRQMMLVK